MPHVELNGQKIFYEDSGGEGPAIVLGHGFLMNHTMFDPQVRDLAPKYRVIRHDQRGFGQTVTDGKPFSYWDCADDALRLCDYLGIKQAVFGGMSQGGFVSLRIALRYPERVKALVLIATQAGVDDAETIAGYRQMMGTWAEHGPSAQLRETIAGLILGEKDTWEPWVSNWAAMGKDALIHPSSCLLERDDLIARLGEIKAPTLIIHGLADAAIRVELARLMQEKLPHCKGLVAVPGAAHAPNLTHAHVVNPPLLEFLRQYA